MAHIVAFSPGGPRGRAAHRPIDINGAANLMLLCPACHKLIDDEEESYPIRELREYKRLHEQRIKVSTSSSGTNETRVIKVVSWVRGQDVEILDSDVDSAIFPRFSEKGKDCVIDLRTHGDLTPRKMALAASTITERFGDLYSAGKSGVQLEHVSVFALAPIPVLVHLGSQLSTKVKTDIFQRHRETDAWDWKKGDGRLSFSTALRKRGSTVGKAALIVSVSGKIHPSELPPEIRRGHWIYEIEADVKTMRTDLLETRGDLGRFRRAYEEIQGRLTSDHGRRLRKMDVFAAVPAPIAVTMGFARLPQIAPALRVYQNEPLNGGFKHVMEVA
jgi:hypothetical protein